MIKFISSLLASIMMGCIFVLFVFFACEAIQTAWLRRLLILTVMIACSFIRDVLTDVLTDTID